MKTACTFLLLALCQVASAQLAVSPEVFEFGRVREHERPVGTIALTNAAAIQARVDNAVTGAGLDALLPGGGESAYRLVMAARIGGELRTRAVQGLTAAGVKLIKYNNRYFDRA